MDQEKIGRFIASCRKECGYTQASLGEKLGITDRAVSKWERGKSMPDASIMLELCDLLGISVNELLTGEHITMENYKEKAEENMLELQEKKIKAQKSLLRVELAWLAIALLLIPVHLAINYYYPENTGTGIGPLIAMIGIVMFAEVHGVSPLEFWRLSKERTKRFLIQRKNFYPLTAGVTCRILEPEKGAAEKRHFKAPEVR